MNEIGDQNIISLASERMWGKRYNPKDHKSGFRPTAEGAKGGEGNAAIPEQKRSAGNQANPGIPRTEG